MNRIDLDFFFQVSNDEIENKLNFYFNSLLNKIEQYLNLETINIPLDISISNTKASLKSSKNKIYTLGFNLINEKGKYIVIIYENFKKFLKFILLKVAYLCFLPNEVIYNEIVNIFINQKIKIDLEPLESTKLWFELNKNQYLNFEFLSGEFDRLEKFLKQKTIENYDSPFIFFIKYVRRNLTLVSENKSNFFELFFREYYRSSPESLRNEELIETLRIFIKIFYKMQVYKNLSEYKQYFKEFKQKNIIKTRISLRKFTYHLRNLRDYSLLSPSYQINWPALKIFSIYVNIKFNPYLKNSDIKKFSAKLPLFILQKQARKSFGYELEGYFVIPKIYYNDLTKFIKELEIKGYIIGASIIMIRGLDHICNLNNFRDFTDPHALINPFKDEYDEKYEISSNIDYGEKEFDKQLDLIDLLIIDRIRYFSITGFGFEKTNENLKNLKSDIINEILIQRNFIRTLRKQLGKIQNSSKLRNDFINLINSNKDFGFFYVREMLQEYVIFLINLLDLLKKTKSVMNYLQIKQMLMENPNLKSIEMIILFQNYFKKKSDFKNLIDLYYKSKTAYVEELNKFKIFSDFVDVCFNLKIYNLQSIIQIIKNNSLKTKIFKTKDLRLRKIYEKNKLYKITKQLIEKKLTEYLNHDPQIIKPLLINGIYFHYSQFFLVKVKSDKYSLKKIKELKSFFKNVVIGHTNPIFITLLLPYLINEEKNMFISYMYYTFKENIISIKSFYWSGFQEAFTLRYFYNLEEQQFFYTKDLFNQISLYTSKLFNLAKKPLQERVSNNLSNLWHNKNLNILNLVKLIENRIENQKLDFSIKNINALLKFHQDLKLNLLNIAAYKKLKLEKYFIDNINLIEFIPSFQKFGLSSNFLYFYPSCIDEIDFKLLLGNTFSSIKYIAQIDVSNSFLIKYTYPYQHQGFKPYLNWLTKTKKVIREFCSFNIKKVYYILHFNYNLSSDGWDIDPNRFKIYFQNILFNPHYKVQIQGLKDYIIQDMENLDYFGPESNEYKKLIQIYDRKSIDIRSVWATAINLKRAVFIRDLMEKDLIFPYIILKNMELIEEIYIILPNVREMFNEKIIQIFSFFNVVFINEIEGSYYIHGFDDIVDFENGFFIKISIPHCQIDELEHLFELIFEYMEIDDYIIMNDIVEGDSLLKTTYGNLDFLKRYNPLTNLIWNNKDKRWMNHQLLTKKFEPLYPDLFYGQKLVCKSCGASLKKGRICIDCLYQIAASEKDVKEEVRKILNFELLEVYSEILNSIKNDIALGLDADVLKITIEEKVHEFFKKLDSFVRRTFNPFSFFDE